MSGQINSHQDPAASASKTQQQIALSSVGKSSTSKAAAPSPLAPLSSINSVKYDVCIDTLMNGCVNAFVHLYKLSHRPPVCVDELAQKMFSIPDEKLPWVQDLLISAEMKRRRSDFKGAFTACVELSKYFEGNGDKDQAIFFLEQALSHSSESLDRALEGEAHEVFGLLFERLGMTVEATIHHETRLKLAEIIGDSEVKTRAWQNLYHIYLRRGKEALERCELESARQFNEKAVAIAKVAGDSHREAEAYAALGNINVLLGDMQRALEFHQRFQLLSRAAKDVHGESQAALEVARLQERLGQTNDAITSLKSALSLAEEASDLQGICSACKQLGEVYKRAHQSVKSVHYFTQAFKAARDIGDPELIETTRIALGFAIGEHHFSQEQKGFVDIVCNDMPALLEWMGSGVL